MATTTTAASSLAALAASFSSQQIQLHAVLLMASILSRLWDHILYGNSGHPPSILPRAVAALLLVLARSREGRTREPAGYRENGCVVSAILRKRVSKCGKKTAKKRTASQVRCVGEARPGPLS